MRRSSRPCPGPSPSPRSDSSHTWTRLRTSSVRASCRSSTRAGGAIRFGFRGVPVDGSVLGELEIQAFSAKSMRVTIHGLSVHPGSAKGKLINAVNLPAELVMSLPKDRLSPETTEGREGYVHPHRISGNAEEAIVDFIVRDHDDELLEQHMVLLRELVHEVAEREPRAHVEIEERGSYRNMHPYIEESPRVVEAALEAIRRVRGGPRLAITRGGTDGAILSAQGLPTPNLFTGGQEYHSVREWASVQDMAAAAATLVELLGVWTDGPSSGGWPHGADPARPGYPGS